MYLQAYPITIKVGTQWEQIETIEPKFFSQTHYTFLYIGKRWASERLPEYFRSGISTDNFLEAKLIIGKLSAAERPDVILIDVPFNKSELRNFQFLLKSTPSMSSTIVIYNERKITDEHINFLKQSGLVDDIVRFDAEEINYASKISFLRKVRQHQEEMAEKTNLEKKPNSRLSFKRLMDILGSCIAILLLSPIFLIIAIIIRIESRGPVMYTSRRAGQGFKVFNFYKFRTMEVGADKKIDQVSHLNQYKGDGDCANFLKIVNDPRVTRVGKFLRKTSLDELPQFFNVLKGDMSLVGNRPLPLYEASTLTTNEFVERFMAPAGITGLWQIKKRGLETMSTEERINLDIFYARRANILYDLWIMAKTPTALFQKSNV
jgi:lipopolysaccharide/colanic/teichoic acid biosynthesis glycosyltransferase